MERRLREAVDVPVFHDDEHGTAVVVLSALAIALRVTGKTLDDVRIVLSGAGAAGTAIVRLLQAAASPQIAVYDSHGVLHPGREDISGEKRWLAEHTQPSSHETELGKALDGADVFIGVSAAGLLQEQDVARMADGAIGLRASPAAEGQVVMIRVGTSGWSYDHWHPELYPPGLAAGDRLARYAAAFCTAELNASFYRWPRPSAFSNWRQRLPDGFRLSVKAPRGLTHARRLYAPETWLERIAAGWHELGGTRAVLLVQLAPSHARDDARLAYFLELVPDWMRVAVEFRHASWHCEDVFALLAAHRAGYCVMSGAGLPCILRATTDFAYVRMHGPDHHHLYAGSYPDADLSWWASRIGEWDTVGHDVFVYFNNDGDANAVRNARTLRALLGQ